jgi:hypothetical protein
MVLPRVTRTKHLVPAFAIAVDKSLRTSYAPYMSRWRKFGRISDYLHEK